MERYTSCEDAIKKGSAIASLRVSTEGGEAMEQALEDCERIDEDEW